MEFTCSVIMTMMITSQRFPLCCLITVEDLSPSNLFFHLCNAAFTFSFGSNCFYLGTLSGEKNQILYLYMLVLISTVRNWMFVLFCFLNLHNLSSAGCFATFTASDCYINHENTAPQSQSCSLNELTRYLLININWLGIRNAVWQKICPILSSGGHSPVINRSLIFKPQQPFNLLLNYGLTEN